MKWIFFYDGACHLCSREIMHYQRLPGSENIEFVDIAGSDFVAENFGLDSVLVNRSMHVKSPTGEIFTGVDAFIEIWKVLPKYKNYAWVASRPEVKPFLKLGYKIFARLRIYLPKRKGGCEACAVVHEKIN